MKLKYLILNKLADSLSNYRTPVYDKIQCLNIYGKVKGAVNTWDCTYIKELEGKEQAGMISVDKLLEEELGESKCCDIYFCEEHNLVCIHNHSKDGYIETVHECFDPSEERIYLLCEDKVSYESVKGYVEQSSKYHNFLQITDKLPYGDIFEELFNSSKSENIIDNNKDVKQKNLEIQNNDIEDDFDFEINYKNKTDENAMER